jgi:CheY-like chemotaxis protein
MSSILIAEDDQMVQRILVRMIKRSGYQGEVLVANDADEAIQFAQDHHTQGIDLIFVDTGLYPQGDQAFFDALKSICHETPILVSSGYGEDIIRTVNYFGDKPISGVLSKPFGMAEVKEVLVRFSLLADS